MTILNLWSLGRFVQWSILGRFFLQNWYIFFALSIGWELLELVLPFEFAGTWDNKISDVFVTSLDSGLKTDCVTIQLNP